MGGLLSFFSGDERKRDVVRPTYINPVKESTYARTPRPSTYDSSPWGTTYDSSSRGTTYDSSSWGTTYVSPPMVEVKVTAPETMDNLCGPKNLSPSQIHYSQDSIAPTFYEGGRHANVRIGETLDELLRNKIKIKDIPRIRVVWYKQNWFSLDNRRLWIFKKYEQLKGNQKITVKVVPFEDDAKFTTTNNGRSIEIRGKEGGFYWRTFKR